MANPDKGQVELELGGKVYLLQFDNNAIRNLEQSLGYGVAYLLSNFAKLVGLDFVAKAIHAGMMHDPLYRKMTVQKIVDAMDPAAFELYVEKIVQGILGWKGIDLPADGESETVGAPADPQ